MTPTTTACPTAGRSRHHLNAHHANAKGDPDHDGLNNLGEFRHDTRPHSADTDDDGDDDGDEVHDGCASTDPTDSDTDGDGVEDGARGLGRRRHRQRRRRPATDNCQGDDDSGDDEGGDDRALVMYVVR